jgi:aspartyl-tRNA(Asn)/glutamyl-tRNA(Gln) amidotransferase subunit C
MKISKEEVEKISQLARLKLTSREKEKFSRELSSILEYFKKLQSLDTARVEPTAQVAGLKNTASEDRIKDYSDSDEIKKQFPDRDDGYLKVKSVFE